MCLIRLVTAVFGSSEQFYLEKWACRAVPSLHRESIYREPDTYIAHCVYVCVSVCLQTVADLSICAWYSYVWSRNKRPGLPVADFGGGVGSVDHPLQPALAGGVHFHAYTRLTKLMQLQHQERPWHMKVACVYVFYTLTLT